MIILVQLVHPAHYYYYRDTMRNLKNDDHRVIVAMVKKDMLEELLKEDGVEYVDICPVSHKKWGSAKYAFFVEGHVVKTYFATFGQLMKLQLINNEKKPSLFCYKFDLPYLCRIQKYGHAIGFMEQPL